LRTKNILIRAPNWVGDVVMATPTFRCVRENFPRACISLLIRPYVSRVVDDAPWFDEVIVHDDRSPRDVIELAKRLRRGRYDLALLLPNNFKSALIAALGGVRRRVGYLREGRGMLLTDSLERPSRNGKFLPTYMGDYYLALCELIGCEISDRRPQLFVSREAEGKADELLRYFGVEPAAEFAIINPGASFGSSKFWREEKFAAVGDMIADRYGLRILISCTRGELPIARRISSLMRHEAVCLAEGKPALELDILKALVRRCRLLVTLDSGPRHFAVAFGIPVVTIMGPNSPLYTQTEFERGIVVRVDVDCGPCQQKVCKTDHRCMERITPEMVFAACEELLGR